MSVVDRVYARALYDAARDHDALERVAEQLGAVAAAVRDLPQLRSLIGNPQVDAESKAAVLEAAIEEPDELVRNFLRLVAEKGRAGNIVGIHAELEEAIARAAGQLTVTLTTAYELSDEEARAIVERIERASGRRIEAERRVDPSLIGGIVLQAGSLRADASVRGRLERMRQELRTR